MGKRGRCRGIPRLVGGWLLCAPQLLSQCSQGPRREWAWPVHRFPGLGPLGCLPQSRYVPKTLPWDGSKPCRARGQEMEGGSQEASAKSRWSFQVMSRPCTRNFGLKGRNRVLHPLQMRTGSRWASPRSSPGHHGSQLPLRSQDRNTWWLSAVADPSPLLRGQDETEPAEGAAAVLGPRLSVTPFQEAYWACLSMCLPRPRFAQGTLEWVIEHTGARAGSLSNGTRARVMEPPPELRGAC